LEECVRREIIVNVNFDYFKFTFIFYLIEKINLIEGEFNGK